MLGVIIFEWEINIRRTSVLGLVGAGGLGLVFFGDWPDGVTLLGAGTVVAMGAFTLYRERRTMKPVTPGLRIR